MQRLNRLGTSFLVGILAAVPAAAHSPICNCYDNGDGTITCEGGFSDGGSAAGVAIRVVGAGERVLIAGEMDATSTFSFKMPDQEFHVVFDAGDSHIVTIFGDDIE
jgi:hypothetical protein